MKLPASVPQEHVAREALERARDVLESDPARAVLLAQDLLGDASVAERVHALLIIGSAHYRQGALEQALPFLKEAQAQFESERDLSHSHEVTLMLGRVYRDLGRFKDALGQFGTALDIARSLGDTAAELDALNLQAGVLSTQGQHRHALGVLEQALSLARTQALQEPLANILNNLGSLHTLQGNYPQALECLQEAYDLFREVGPNTRGSITNLISLGILYREMGNEDEARDFFLQARDTAHLMNDLIAKAVALNNLANVELHAQAWKAARDGFQEALTLAQAAGAQQFVLDNLDGLGQVSVALGEHAQAVTIHQEVLELARQSGDRDAELDALLNLGRDHLAMHRADGALTPLQEALALAVELERQRAVFEAHELLSQAYEQEGDLAKALHHYRAFHAAEKVIFNEENERRTRQLTVQFEVERARHEAEVYRIRTEVLRQARDEAEASVRERTRELEASQLEIVTRLAVAAEFRDDDTGEHTRRVGRNAAAIAHVLGWPESEVKLLFIAARLHDVGKIGIRDAILHKPGKLDPDEMALIKTHTTIGARILSGGNSPLLVMAEEIALSHHERWDGKGYPLGLTGEAIPLVARIVAVADVLDALTHERPYKRAWSTSEALAEITRQRGHHFDPRVVDACLQIFAPQGALSPTEVSPDWEGTLQGLQRLPRDPSCYITDERNNAALKERYEKLLAQRTRELEASRREVQASSRRLQKLAFTDVLTGLGNRRAFEADLEAEVARARHQGDTVSVLTLDLDTLKTINDTEGHERGDALLRTFAQTISAQLQTRGRVYRVAGDEFAAILIHTSTSDFAMVRAQLEQAIETVQAEGYRDASASVGLAALPEEAEASGDLVRLSDQRMYRDKHNKRPDTHRGDRLR